jgi:formylmethanofuran dehydrogenase subunit C
MTGYTLRWKTAIAGPIDGSVLRPDLLGTQDIAAVNTAQILIGNRPYRFHDVFTVEGAPGPLLTVQGSSRFIHLGRGMVSGRLQVLGEAGDYCGMQMSGGSLIVQGSAGDFLGAGMSGGLIRVQASVGDNAGGPPPTDSKGMSGGEILIHGAAGQRLGFRMRRGLIAAASAGPYAGYMMLAGTLLVVQGSLMHSGIELRRGSIISLERNQPTELGQHFQFDYRSRPVILKLLLGRLREWEYPLPEGCRHGLYDLYSGDRLNLNRGEFWQWRGA